MPPADDSPDLPPSPAGVLLAAGAGTRMGMPKALVRDADGTLWLHRAIDALRDGGCELVLVVLGARASDARPLVPGGVHHVVADDWEDGLSASLATALRALPNVSPESTSAVITLVDLPDVDATVVARVLDTVGAETGGLGRATYDGRPGHPVVIGSDHWERVIAESSGDHGARDFFRTTDHTSVECGDLATGADVDRPRD